KQDWSVRDILAHLRACSDVWGNSIEAMLADENPVLQDVHPRHWLKQTNYLDLRFRESLQALASQRAKMLSVLRQLSFEEWGRPAMIGGRKHTVFSQVRRMAKHEAEHITQIAGMLQTSADRMKMDPCV
ncbi:MAG TPA: DinB family protein, partial [Anaerolineales bacterium]|nr:DinB family protein [Anaerolineales bacterium]